MTIHALSLVALLAATQPAQPPDSPPQGPAPTEPTATAQADDTTGADIAQEPVGGAGVSPLEIVPRVELRQSFQRLSSGAALHETTAEMDIQFVERLLLRFDVPYRVLGTSTGQVSGVGDVQVGALGIVESTPVRLVALIAGLVLNTATQPPLGMGKQQVFFGGGAAVKPRRWLLTYGVLQEQVSVAGDAARPDINELMVDLGVILFGRQYNWLKADLIPTVDFPNSVTGRFFGILEAGSLLVGRVGLFMRTGTQFLGPRQLDYSVTGGVRYLFRLAKGKPL